MSTWPGVGRFYAAGSANGHSPGCSRDGGGLLAHPGYAQPGGSRPGRVGQPVSAPTVIGALAAELLVPGTACALGAMARLQAPTMSIRWALLRIHTDTAQKPLSSEGGLHL